MHWPDELKHGVLQNAGARNFLQGVSNLEPAAAPLEGLWKPQGWQGRSQGSDSTPASTGVAEFATLISSQMVLMLLVWRPHFETH